MEGGELEATNTAYGLVQRCCEHYDNPSGFIVYKEFD
jgi:hypothetical protein